ncbi:uncharacterized protein LOC129569532 [Sitodiplosis mosellana]|uniref:uncharacterized protein LOC129569532 n=1 Tax=Sitodiplosis mosellana TaxID=263140 RepID=UPI002445238C|nr:uncharacterized protein LOC129569532 [Sitodiplosis mosellana]XP_055304392.1 uncharacterized protein LOC129569532 [Sitodiplosis mosellana]
MGDSNEPVSKRLRRRKDTTTSEASKSSTKPPGNTLPTSELASDNLPAHENVSNSLLRLTDGCLQKLFERLDIESLCQMANVCKRFRPISERAFSERHKKFVFEGRSCKNSVFRRVLCKFGHLITTIDASEAHFVPGEKLDVGAIAKYCSNSLDKLILQKATIDCDVVKPLFSRLKYLDLAMCDFTGNKNGLFANCPNLEFFGFEADFCGPDPLDMGRDRSIRFVAKKFPKLESVAFDCSYTGFWTFFDLLKLNPQVKILDIIAPSEDMYIQSVVQYTKNVEALAIHTGFMSTTPEIQTRKVFLQLSKLKKLQKLLIEAGDETYGKLVAPLMDAFAKDKVPINRLNLREFTIGSKEIKSILKLKTMKIMSLDEVVNVTDADLVPLTKELPLLENLQLYFGTKARTPITVSGLAKMIKAGKHLDYVALVGVQNLKIDKKAFDDLLKAAQSRGNEKTLTIDIVGKKKTTSFNVPENIQRAGDKHMKILYTTSD